MSVAERLPVIAWRSLLSSSREGPGTVLTLTGDFDIVTLPDLVDALSRVCAMNAGPVVVDLGGTTFMDTCTTRALARTVLFLSYQKRSMTFRSPSGPSLRLLEFFGLSHLVEPSTATSA